MAEETVYYGRVLSTNGRAGTGGLVYCELEIESIRRKVNRLVYGSVRKGDVVKLYECDREVGRGRR